MKFEFTKRFQKEYKQLSISKKLNSSFEEVIANITNAKKISDIKNIKKLSGFKVYFRIRIGTYRIGVKIENETVIFAAFDNRKDIYKRFP